MTEATKILLNLPYFITSMSSKKFFRFIGFEDNLTAIVDIKTRDSLSFFLFWNFCKDFFVLDDLNLSPNYPVSLGTVLLLTNLKLFIFFYMKMFKKYSLHLLALYFTHNQKFKKLFLTTQLNTNFWFFLDFLFNSSLFFQYFLSVNLLGLKAVVHNFMKLVTVKHYFITYSLTFFFNSLVLDSRGSLLIRIYYSFLKLFL